MEVSFPHGCRHQNTQRNFVRCSHGAAYEEYRLLGCNQTTRLYIPETKLFVLQLRFGTKFEGPRGAWCPSGLLLTPQILNAIVWGETLMEGARKGRLGASAEERKKREEVVINYICFVVL